MSTAALALDLAQAAQRIRYKGRLQHVGEGKINQLVLGIKDVGPTALAKHRALVLAVGVQREAVVSAITDTRSRNIVVEWVAIIAAGVAPDAELRQHQTLIRGFGEGYTAPLTGRNESTPCHSGVK